jgi:hypothetical protein
MIAPYLPTFDPIHDAPIGHRIVAWLKGADPTDPWRWEGELVGIVWFLDGTVEWLVDGHGLDYSTIRWEFADVRLCARGGGV